MAAIPTNRRGSPGSQVYQSIEATADYYSPFTYAQLLTFYDSFESSIDPASGSFLGVTTTGTIWGKQSILFAVGIIPPAAAVTGRLLDRTSSIITVEGADGISGTNGSTQALGNDKRERIVSLANSYIGAGNSTDPARFQGLLASANDGDLVKRNFFQAPNLSTCGLAVRGFWRAAGVQDSSLTDKYKIGAAISDTINIGRKNGALVSPKQIKDGSYSIQPGDMVLVQTPSDDGISHQHVYTVTSVDGNGHYTSVDGGQVDSHGQQAIGQYSRTIKENADGTLVDNNGYGPRNVVAVIDVSKLPFDFDNGGTKAVSGDASNGNWNINGAPNAKAAAQQQASQAGSPLLATATGQDLTAAQKNAIQATQFALGQMAKCPPLAMMVNPSSFSVKGEKIVNDGNWGRNGPIIEYWGDQQDKISGSGKLASFMAIDTSNANGPGLTRWARNYSASWQNFQSLYHIYRSNGAVFLPDDTTRREYQNLSLVGSIYIYYDNVIYIGSFDSFNLTENDTAPFSAEYSFEFTVRASFLLDRTDDAFDYGVPQITQGASIPFQTPPPESRVITTQPVAQPQGVLQGVF